MATTRGAVSRLLALTIAIVLFVPLVWALIVVPLIGALGVSAGTTGTIGWGVALAVGVGIGYVLYRDLPTAIAAPSKGIAGTMDDRDE